MTVALVTYNSAALLPDCLSSIPAAMDGLSYELVVVDNDSGDGSADLAAALVPGSTVIRMGRNAGYAAGINAAASARSSRAVLALNPDVRLTPACIRPLLDALDLPGTGITVPKVVNGSGVLDPSLRREPTLGRAFGEAVLGGHRAGRFAPLGEKVTQAGAYERPGVADWATGAAMLVARTCLDAVGPWDESFFLYSEETDFALRARDAGFSLRFVPDAVVVHLGSGELAPALWAVLTVNRVRLYRRRHGRVAGTAFWALVVANEGLRWLHGPRRHRAAFRALLRRGASGSGMAELG